MDIPESRGHEAARQEQPHGRIDIERKIREQEYPWRDEEILSHLYWDRELSQEDIGDLLGCDQAAVSRWMDCLDVETREPSDRVGLHPTFVPLPGGYTMIQCRTNGICDAVRHHQILACVNHDPHRVFAPDTDVHHRIGSNQLGIQIDIPENLDVLDRSEHRRLHAKGDVDLPDAEDVDAIDEYLADILRNSD